MLTDLVNQSGRMYAPDRVADFAEKSQKTCQIKFFFVSPKYNSKAIVMLFQYFPFIARLDDNLVD